MKIFHIGLFDNNQGLLGLRVALAGLFGQENYREISWPLYMTQHNNQGKEKAQLNFDHDVITIMHEFRPDIVFIHVQNGEALSDRVLDYIGSQPFFSVGFTGDVRKPLPEFYLHHGKCFSLSLFTNMDDVRICHAHGINADFIHVGYDDLIYNPDGPVDKNAPEIVFMGNNYNKMFPLSDYRKEIVRNLTLRYGDKFGVYGANWEELGHRRNLMTDHNTEATVYRSCKIAINCSHFNLDRYSSDRLNRIMGCGAFCLSHHYEGLEQDFVPEQDLEIFHNIGQLIDKIDLYLLPENENNIKKIAKHGYEKIKSNYTWKHFADKIYYGFYRNYKGKSNSCS